MYELFFVFAYFYQLLIIYVYLLGKAFPSYGGNPALPHPPLPSNLVFAGVDQELGARAVVLELRL